jgi:glutathione S-transferase
MIKIWGRKDASNVQKALWCCDEIGLNYERVDIGGSFGGNREKPYLDLNPNGLVPTIQDGDFVLWESNAIVRYLVDKYGRGRLIPSTPEGRAEANRWMDWTLTILSPAFIALHRAFIRTAPEKRDPALIQSSLEKALAAWRILDHHLERNRYVAGEEFSMGDISPGVWVSRWFKMPVERPAMAHLERWHRLLCERPPYQRHVMTGPP